MLNKIATILINDLNRAIHRSEKLQGALLYLGKKDLARIAEMAFEDMSLMRTTLRIRRERKQFARRELAGRECQSFTDTDGIPGSRSRLVLCAERSVHLLEGLQAGLIALDLDELARVAELAHGDVLKIQMTMRFQREMRHRSRQNAMLEDIKHLVTMSGRPSVHVAIRLGRIVAKM